MTMDSIILKEKYKIGDVIIEEGFTSNYAYVVLEGEVKVTKKIKDKRVVIGTLKKGSVLGEMGLIDQSSRTATVVALTDVEVGMINKESFMKMLNEVPEDFRCVVVALVDRLKITTEKLAGIGLQLENARRAINSLSLHTHEE